MNEQNEVSEAIHNLGAKILKFDSIQKLTVDEPLDALYGKTIEPGKYVVVDARIFIPVRT